MKLVRILLWSAGMLVMMAASAQTFSNLHTFTNSPGDGANPNGGLLLSGSGLYGTTIDGGSANNGVIFKVNTNSAGYSVLKHFSTSALNGAGVSTNNGGANPMGGLTLGGGTLYGAASQAGSSGSGTLFSLNTNGTGFNAFKNFSPRQSASNTNDDGARPNAGLVLLGDTLYGTTYFGGKFGNGSVFKVNTNGTGYTVLRHFAASGFDPSASGFTNSDGLNSQAALVLSGDTLYGTTIGGGTGGKGTVFKVGTNGTGFTVIKNFEPTRFTTNSEGAAPSPNLVLSGNTLYGTAVLGGLTGNGTVFKVNTDGSGFNVLKTFSTRISSTNVDGAYPTWGLVLSGDTLYGTTQIGGADGDGTLFALKTNGTGFVVMHNFSPDEGDPAGNLVVLGDALFGTTENSALNALGTVFNFQLPSPSTPSTGALQVALSPPGAVTAGAQWQVDGGPFQNSDAILTGIPFGNHLLTFKTVSGWTVPGTQVVIINGGATNSTSGTYAPAPATGALQVTIHPSGAVSDGAQWQVDGQAFQNSGAIVTGLSVGDHTVVFSTVSGWVTPSNQTVTISADTTSTTSGTYTQPPGALRVTINPPAAVNAGAQWQVDGGTFLNNGVVAGNLGVSNHTVSFKSISGWITPSNQTVAVTSGVTNDIAVTYTQPDTVKPKIVITAPTPNQLWNSGVFIAAGNATDNVAVASVYLQLNNNAWTNATTADNWTNWTAPVTLTPGTNTLRAYALDSSGNNSGTNSVNVIYALANVLGVQIVGIGTVTPNLNGQSLQIGVRYTMTAKAGSGFVFSGWSGSLTTNKTVLSFVMQSNYAFTATFTDTVKPTLVITLPKSGQKWSNAVFNVTGTVKDNGPLANVFYQLNGASWSDAATANGWSNWTATVTLPPGPNTLRAYAMDAQGNRSATNSVSFTYILSAPLIVQTNGPGTISPNYNASLLQVGGKYSMTAKAATGFAFSKWTDGAAATVTNIPTLTFTMASNLVFIAKFVDVTRPVNIITVPAVNQKWSNAVFNVSGKATDNVGVSNVWYQLNGASWSNAATANGWSNWTATVTLTPGPNTLRAYAMDAQGNRSLTNSVNFTYILSAPLIVQTNGRGTISPNYNASLLQVGGKYSMTAKAATGFAFSKWTDGAAATVTNMPVLSFTMASNLIFIANFVDVTRPVNIITGPLVNQTWSNAVLNAAGKATDNVGVSNVSYQLNGAGWNPAILALNHTNWSTTNLTLLSGSNMIQAFATDGAGNASLTNSVKFTYTVLPVADWAPDSLNGLLAQAAPSNGSPTSVSFDILTFAQSGTNSDDFGVGTYTYLKGSTNTAQLTLSFAAPPGETNDTGSVDLIFTNHYAGYFTNTDSHDFGGINLVIATNLLPGSLAGKTVTAVASNGSQTNSLKLVNGVGFTKTTTGVSGTSSGTYTLTRFSPVCGLLTLTFTNSTDVGRVVYVQTVFTNATAGIYFQSSYNLGVRQDSDTGKFSVR